MNNSDFPGNFPNQPSIASRLMKSRWLCGKLFQPPDPESDELDLGVEVYTGEKSVKAEKPTILSFPSLTPPNFDLNWSEISTLSRQSDELKIDSEAVYAQLPVCVNCADVDWAVEKKNAEIET
ncbi:MAG TPA: hypothetical protein VNZ25_02280 [Candidatus Angelobacter sp.]|nr:hypothetical protein [Candidatus Angelobacter sp.]